MARRKKSKKAPKEEKESSSFVGLAVVGVLFGIVFGLVLSQAADNIEASISGVDVPTIKLSIEDIKARAAVLPCEDKEDANKCAIMAKRGSCEQAPGWMQVMCAASCNACEMLDFDVRCNPERLNLTLEPAFRPGEMSQMFESLPRRYPDLDVIFLSKPPEGPYVVQFNNFLSDSEIDAMLNNVGILKRSTDQGKIDEKTGVQSQTVSNTRTSENAWCVGACEQNPIIAGVKKRISELTLVDEDNFEAFQMLRYELGQEYQRHHDMSPVLSKNLQGPRVLTFFLYLSDVEEGGGTRFTDLDPPITMIPKKGSAILWPSVLDADLMQQDPQTFHQALPVTKGTKYGANSWIHLYNYKVPNLYGCTGSFA